MRRERKRMASGETPEEARARKEEAKRLRRQRQNLRNLVASVAASLGVVVFLVLVVARPNDEAIVQPIDYAAVAEDTQPSAPGELVVPELDETWSANRAGLDQESYGLVWAIGLISTTGDYVEIAQVFNGDSDATVELVGPGGTRTASVVAGDDSIAWESIDRSELNDPGNASYALVSDTRDGLLVISGTTETGVLFIASMVQSQQPELWP